MANHDDRAQLIQLAEVLKRRDWPARIRQRGDRFTLTVTNPADEELNESVVCSASDNGLAYSVPGGQELGPTADVEKVADRLQNMLRSVRA
ncbi:hypothetical protein [Actinoallomurus sp. NPDC052274]|uniref:hypothetical protein n=1 Tax=Actinoallomurus sp. NPDC052274 TaxID=3155420 RepID=UPI0034399344